MTSQFDLNFKVKLRDGEFNEVSNVRKIEKHEEGYYFKCIAGRTLLFVPTDYLAYYEQK